jgi:hypothetical protein
LHLQRVEEVGEVELQQQQEQQAPEPIPFPISIYQSLEIPVVLLVDSQLPLL